MARAVHGLITKHAKPSKITKLKDKSFFAVFASFVGFAMAPRSLR